MEFTLTQEQKKEIVQEYGSNIKVIDTAIRVLNELDIIEEPEEFLELVCSIALDVEVMDDMKGSTLQRKSLSEIISAAIVFKYADLNEFPEAKIQKVKKYFNSFYED